MVKAKNESGGHRGSPWTMGDSKVSLARPPRNFVIETEVRSPSRSEYVVPIEWKIFLLGADQNLKEARQAVALTGVRSCTEQVSIKAGLCVRHMPDKFGHQIPIVEPILICVTLFPCKSQIDARRCPAGCKTF